MPSVVGQAPAHVREVAQKFRDQIVIFKESSRRFSSREDYYTDGFERALVDHFVDTSMIAMKLARLQEVLGWWFGRGSKVNILVNKELRAFKEVQATLTQLLLSIRYHKGKHNG